MSSAHVPLASAAAQESRFGGWFGAWGSGSFSCCAAASVTASLGACTSEEVEEPIAYGLKAVHPELTTSPTTSTIADSAAPSPLSEGPRDEADTFPVLLGVGRAEGKGAPGEALGALGSISGGRGARSTAAVEAGPAREAGSAPRFVRTPSFKADHSELPELRIPEGERPLVSGHLDGPFQDVAATIFRHEDSPFDAFLCGDMACSDMRSSPFVEEGSGSSYTTVQRSVFQLPLPSDIPEVVARLLGLGKSVKSTTFTRAVARKGRITLQQISQTQGLLYSERMRVMNIHCLEEDPAGGMAWRTFTRIVWTRPLPWTHGFIVKFIDGRVKAETRINAPKLMRCIQEAAGSVGPQR